MFSGVLPLLLMLGAPPAAEAKPAHGASMDAQLNCVLDDYSDDQQRALDKWANAYFYGGDGAKPLSFEVSVARAKQCKKLHSWTDAKETAALFHAAFSLEQSAANTVLPDAEKDVQIFYAALNEQEAFLVEKSLAYITSGLVGAVDEGEEPGIEALFAQYALNEKIAEKLPNASKDEKSQVSFLLFLGGAKDISRQLFENEFETKTNKPAEADLAVSAPTPKNGEQTQVPPSQSETIPTPPSPNN